MHIAATIWGIRHCRYKNPRFPQHDRRSGKGLSIIQSRVDLLQFRHDLSLWVRTWAMATGRLCGFLCEKYLVYSVANLHHATSFVTTKITMLIKLAIIAHVAFLMFASMAGSAVGQEIPTNNPDFVRKLTQGIIFSYSTAIKIAELLVADFYGEEILRAHQPFTITDDGTRWIIRGRSDLPNVDIRNLSNYKAGQFKIEIMKSDGRIVNLARYPSP